MLKSSPTLVALTLIASLALGGCAAEPEHTGPPPSADDSAEESTAPRNDDPEIGDQDLSILGKYAVEGDEIVDPDVPDDYAVVWERFTELFPAETHPEITMFVAIDAEESGGTDGALERNRLRPDERYLAIDVTGWDEPDELDRTLIHEFAHLMTLRASQVTDEIDDEDCPLYANKGCPLPGSYLEAWETEFWPDAADPDFSEEDDAMQARYDEDEDGYVTEYAATNPDEDIAESFASWVVDDTEVTEGTVVAEKLAFFEDYPELVQLKEDILAAL